MTSTIEKGNSFRAVVDEILVAAGFLSQKEIRVNFKKVDVITLWLRDLIDGPTTFLIEAKDFEGTLPPSEVSDFITEYSPLVSGAHKQADRAWLVSKGPISPDRRANVEAYPNLRCFTFEEFQRQIFQLDGYLRDLIAQYENSGTDEYYIKPHSIDDRDLEFTVREWLDSTNSQPMAIISGYGNGKSTFAKKLSASLAREALDDKSKRAPILVPLGEIVYEPSIDGLVSKVLSSRHRVSNYHFHLFSALNNAGRFVIIYDGFDEMKHGMTFQMFETAVTELLSLDGSHAKILILGRDTAFHGDVEFRAIILGRQITFTGREVQARKRRPLTPVELRQFTLSEAKEYIAKYFAFLIRQERTSNGGTIDDQWIEERVGRLTGGDFDHLIQKPVHAQMLTEIATQQETNLTSLSKYDLYDTFVHYLLDREVRKANRHSAFDRNIRRRFNAAFAWWLWERGSASTTTLGDVPNDLCEEAAREVDHEFDPVGLKRELIAGCLVEKGGGTIFFGHRSIQEFLSAEYLIDSDLLYRSSWGRGEIGKVISKINSEIIDFISDRMSSSPALQDKASQWIGYLDGWKSQNVSLAGFDLFVKLHQSAPIIAPDFWKCPWFIWVNFFATNGRATFELTGNAVGALINIFRTGLQQHPEAQAAVLYLMVQCFMHTRPDNGVVADFIALWLPRKQMGDAIHEARHSRGSTPILIKRDDNLLLWTFLKNIEVEKSETGTTTVSVDLKQIRDLMKDFLGCGFSDDLPVSSENMLRQTTLPQRYSIDASLIYQSLGRFNVKNDEMDRVIRPYLNDDKLRAKIRPLIVTTRH